MFRLIDDEDERTLVLSDDISGFFCDEADWPSVVTFRHAREIDLGKDVREFSVLEVLDRNGRRIGEYPTGRVVPKLATFVLNPDSTSDVSLEIYTSQDSSLTQEFWARWSLGFPGKLGEWIGLSDEELTGLLNVVGNSWAARGLEMRYYGSSGKICLNGHYIESETAFYCAFGESANGPGGYFGWNIAAIRDCVRSSMNSNPLHSMEWLNFSHSVEYLDTEFISRLRDVMVECDIDRIGW
ncbi:hypothetical protein ACFXK0_15750 [Nocardia sp. NPDC059177]|uniref:hypothetical protein n=1 Tax=Nocardia sp. NPDC059177 TaxID=3346759 RepID=UPI0036B44A4B